MKTSLVPIAVAAMVSACVRPYRFDIEPDAGDGSMVDAIQDVAQDSALDVADSDTGDVARVPDSPDSMLDVPIPRQIAPLSTSIVTTQQPLLRWTLAAGVDGASVELCQDPTFAAAQCQTITANGTGTFPASALQRGVWFWRLRGRTAGVTGTRTSPTWEFNVRAIDTPINSSVKTVPDFNLDGYADVVVGAEGASTRTGEAFVYFGSSPAPSSSSTPDLTLLGLDGAGAAFGQGVGSAGDVNGDGYGDLMVAAPEAASGAGKVYVFNGSASGPVSTPSTTIVGTAASGTLGMTLAGVGDVNGDGYGDVMLGAPGAASGAGEVFVYLGGAGGLSTMPATTMMSPGGSTAGFAGDVAGAGDVNGDGFADVVVGATTAASFAGAVYVYVGSTNGLSATPTTTLTGVDGPGAAFGGSLASSDVNGDGYTDVIVGAIGANMTAGKAYAFYGGVLGLHTTADATFAGPGSNGAGFGEVDAEDVNGDGFDDVIASAPNVSSMAGQVYIYFGTSGGVHVSPDVTLTGQDASGGFGGPFCAAGDVDGDGRGDLAISAPAANTNRGHVFLFLGSSTGVATPFAAMFGGMSLSIFGGAVATAVGAPLCGPIMTTRWD